ncbi:MAG: peptidylprolyl isomerase, partial [Halolamina sp.]
RVDFNHPLAGEDIEYEYEVVDVVTDDEQKAEGLLGMTLQQVPDVRIETETVEEEVTVEPDEDEENEEDAEPETEIQEIEQRSLYVDASPQMQMNQQWMFQKQQIAQDLIDRLDLDRVVVEEVIDGSAGGPMGGMMGGMGGMGGAAPEDLEEELEDVDVDADEIVDELEDIDE